MSRYRNWCFTINNPSEEVIEKHERIVWRKRLKRYVCQLEAGESGTPHLQGYAKFRNALTMSALKALFGEGHYEVSKGTDEDNYNYCSKEPRIRGPWFHGWPRKPKIISALRPWQTKVLDFCKTEPDDRTVWYLYEPHGGVGKTVFQKYMCFVNGAMMIDGDSKGSMFAVAAWSRQLDTSAIPVVFMNITRTAHVNWDLVESIKDGIFFSSKYESAMCIMPCPHVIIFANHPPCGCSLSRDKIKTFKIVDNDLVDDGSYGI